MLIRRNVKCPYCGVGITYSFDIPNCCDLNKIIVCDVDAGGCDQPFVVKVKTSVDMEVGVITYSEQHSK